MYIVGVLSITLLGLLVVVVFCSFNFFGWGLHRPELETHQPIIVPSLVAQSTEQLRKMTFALSATDRTGMGTPVRKGSTPAEYQPVPRRTSTSGGGKVVLTPAKSIKPTDETIVEVPLNSKAPEVKI